MIIREFKYSPFSLKLKTPFKNSKGSITSREGFYISIRDEQGAEGIGECSPLPVFSKESLEDISNQLNELPERLLSYNFGNLPEAILLNISSLQLYPSLRFAVEQAILDISYQKKLNLLPFAPETTGKTIKVNAVFGLDDAEKILEGIAGKIQKGYSSFKLKVGRDDPYDDILLVAAVREKFGDDIAIRLDANGAWNADEAIEYVRHLLEFSIEYVEEPCGFISSSLRVADELPGSVALDESITNFNDAYGLIADSRIEHLVIKPMIIGSIFETFNLIREADGLGKKIIISSSFESPIGRKALLLLASSAKHNLAHGLDAVEFFHTGTKGDEFPVINGQIYFDYDKLMNRHS